MRRDDLAQVARAPRSAPRRPRPDRFARPGSRAGAPSSHAPSIALSRLPITAPVARTARGSDGLSVSGRLPALPRAAARRRPRVGVEPAESPQRLDRVREPAAVRHPRSRADDGEIVPDDVRDRERVAPRRRSQREPAALDVGEMFPDAVEDGDVGARAQQPAGRVLLVLERDPGGRRRHQRGGAAREQAQEALAWLHRFGERQRAASRPLALRRSAADVRRRSSRTAAPRRPARDSRSGR